MKLDNRFGDGRFVEEAAVEADRLGFYGFLMSDHYMWQTRSRNDVTTLDTWTTLSYIAAKTQCLLLGTQFTPIPFRQPGVLAKMLSTLDVLSGGRVILGVGAGWSQAEFEGYSEWAEPKVRVDKTEEGLRLMLRLWSEDEVTFDGKYYHAKRAVLEPKPLQRPHPTLFISGRPRSNRMLRLAGMYANIFNVASQTAKGEVVDKAEVLDAVELVRRTAKEANRGDKISYASDLRRAKYEGRDYFRDIESLAELGTEYLVTYFPRDENYLKYLRSFAGEVMPSFK